MASLVEELVTVLEEEEKIYQTLISYGEKKTDILIRADVPELEKLTCLEQLASDDLVTHSNQQVQLLKDIANVLGRTEEKMTVTRLITLLESQPDVQKKLTEARDRLLAAADRMNHLNDQNVALIKQAIELNEFDLTLFKSLRQAPETAEALRDLRLFMFEHVYRNPVAKGEEVKAKAMLEQMYYFYMDHIEQLPAKLLKMLDEGEDKGRIVCDYISGMTDKYAITKFKENFMPQAWKVDGY